MAEATKSPPAKKKRKGKHDEILDAANQVVALWMEFRQLFRMGFTKNPIEDQHEKRFLQIKSELARSQRVLSQRLPEGFRYGARRINDIMTQAISIGAVRDLPMPDKKKLYANWHAAYIALQNLLGVLDVINDGYHINFETVHTPTGNVKQSLTGAGGGKKAEKKSKVGIVVVVIVIAAAVWYFMKK